MNETEHWQRVYATKSTDEVGWYTPHLQTSLRWIADLNLPLDAPIIDVGGGASTLVDDLLEIGHRGICVLDLSEQALSKVRARMGAGAKPVSWLQGDVTEIQLPERHFDLWHDRAAFHFLVAPELQRKYKDKLLAALKMSGHFILGTFGLDAPPQCSGLPVQRYSVEMLSSLFGAEFRLKRHQKEIHHTPSGIEQSYLYCLFQRVA